MKLYNSYLGPTADAGISLGDASYRWDQLWVANGATINDISIDTYIELSDTHIQSITFLYGATNNTYIDMSTDGRILFQALGAGSPYSTPDLSFVGTGYFAEDVGLNSSARLMFRDATIYVYSGDADHLDLVAVTSIDMNADMDISAFNIITDTTTGTIIGTATDQKLGFFNATPVVQQLATVDLGVVLSNMGLRAVGTAYPITTSGAVSLSGTVTITGTTTVGGGVVLTDTNVVCYDGDVITYGGDVVYA